MCFLMESHKGEIERRHVRADELEMDRGKEKAQKRKSYKNRKRNSRWKDDKVKETEDKVKNLQQCQ